VGQDLPAGVHHHLRDRLLLLGDDSCSALALELGPHAGDQLVQALPIGLVQARPTAAEVKMRQPGVGKVPGGPVQRAGDQGQLIAHALPHPLNDFVVSPRLVPVAVQDAGALILVLAPGDLVPAQEVELAEITGQRLGCVLGRFPPVDVGQLGEPGLQLSSSIQQGKMELLFVQRPQRLGFLLLRLPGRPPVLCPLAAVADERGKQHDQDLISRSSHHIS
jgi:hypothetical protein